MKLELKNIKLGPGSEETTQFTADLYVDGKKTAHCDNSGKGGMTDIHPIYSENDAEFNDRRSLLKQAEKYAQTLPGFPSSFGSKEPLPMSLDFWVDLEVEKIMNEKEQKKMLNKIKKDCETKVVIMKRQEYDNFMSGKSPRLSYGVYNLKQKISDFHVGTITQFLNTKVLPFLKEDEYIFNTNLPK